MLAVGPKIPGVGIGLLDRISTVEISPYSVSKQPKEARRPVRAGSKLKSGRPDSPTPTFSGAEVCRLTGVSLRRLQWLAERGFVTPKIRGARRFYQLPQVIEIGLIAELRRNGVSQSNINRVLRYFAKNKINPYDVARSGSELSLLTDGKHVYIEDRHKNVIDILDNSREPIVSIGVPDEVANVVGRDSPDHSNLPAIAESATVAGLRRRPGKQTFDDRSSDPCVAEGRHTPTPIVDEIKRVIPDHEEWLHARNPTLMGKTPSEFIESGDEEPIRELLWSVVHVGVS